MTLGIRKGDAVIVVGGRQRIPAEVRSVGPKWITLTDGYRYHVHTRAREDRPEQRLHTAATLADEDLRASYMRRLVEHYDRRRALSTEALVLSVQALDMVPR